MSDLLDRFGSGYGPRWTYGIISEHATQAVRAGLVEQSIGGDVRLVDPESGESLPVLCSELVWIDTEDGRSTGRCGVPILSDDGFACEAHAEVIAVWRQESEAQVAHWERRIEQEA